MGVQTCWRTRVSHHLSRSPRLVSMSLRSPTFREDWRCSDGPRQELMVSEVKVRLTSSLRMSTSLLNTRTSLSLLLRMAFTAYSLPIVQIRKLYSILTIELFLDSIHNTKSAITDSCFIVILLCDVAFLWLNEILPLHKVISAHFRLQSSRLICVHSVLVVLTRWLCLLSL